MSQIVKRVVGRPHRFGGEEHTGWLPPGAAKPLPTPIYDVLLDVEIQQITGGYLLIYASQDGKFRADSWYEAMVDAEAAANEWFGISAEQWLPGPTAP